MPLDAARSALAIVEIVWLARRDAASWVVSDPANARALRQASAELAAAVEAAEEHSVDEARAAQISEAIAQVCAALRPSDSMGALLTTAARLVRGEKRSRARGACCR